MNSLSREKEYLRDQYYQAIDEIVEGRSMKVNRAYKILRKLNKSLDIYDSVKDNISDAVRRNKSKDLCAEMKLLTDDILDNYDKFGLGKKNPVYTEAERMRIVRTLQYLHGERETLREKFNRWFDL